MNNNLKRALRVLAFGAASAIAGLGAGNIVGFSAVESALFGAVTAILGLVMALLFIYAGKGNVPESDFNATINSAIENVQAKSKGDEK